MGKLNVFDINISNPGGVYHAGQIVQGQVVVQLNEEMKMRGIRLQFLGGANVHWTERHSTGSGKNRRTTTRTYSSHEEYFNMILTLFGKNPGASGDNPILPAGHYQYPFSFQLPPTLPSSFEGAWGRVRYHLKATIDRPWRFDHNTKRAFTVISQLDLNTQPNILTPFSGTNEKTLCCWCCKSGPISATVSLDRQGYVPGECIRVSGEVANLSSRSVKASKAVLTQHIGFHATSKSRWTTKIVGEVRKGAIEAGGTEVWNAEMLHIPPVPPSNLVGCNIIDIKYIFTFVVDPSGPAFDLEIPTEIIVGTIPLRTAPPSTPYGFSAEAAYGMPQPGFNNQVMPQPSAPPPVADAGPVPAAPPPAYEECVFGKVDIRDDTDNEYTMGQKDFAPAYTYYRWDQPGSGFSPRQ